MATTLLVVGIPALDVAWVILRRRFWEHRSAFMADRKHLHFRLLDIGLSHRQVVLFLYLIAASFGMISLFLQSKQKLIALGILTDNFWRILALTPAISVRAMYIFESVLISTALISVSFSSAFCGVILSLAS